MNKHVFAALSLSFGLGLAVSSASCGPTCPAGQQSCGSSNAAASDAGATGNDTVKCDLLTAFRSCMTGYCKTASNPFCTCYARGFDIDPSNNCRCIDFDTKSFCDQAKGSGMNAASYDCATDSSRVSSICVPVN